MPSTLCSHRRAHLCGFDLNLTYPQTEPLPSFSPTAHPSSFWSFAPNEAPSALDRREILKSILDRRHFDGSKSSGRSTGHALQSRQSSELPDVVTPSYGCALFDEMIDYAANFSFPWSMFFSPIFGIYLDHLCRAVVQLLEISTCAVIMTWQY